MSTPSAERTTAKAAPRAVQRQVAEANALLDSLKTKPNAPPPAAAPAAPPAAAPAAPPDAASAAPPDAASAAPAEPPTAPAAPAAPAPDKYKQMYDVLKGKYDKEVPDLRTENALLKDENRRIETLLAQLADRPAPAAPAAPGSLPKPTSFSKQEVEDYGTEFFDVVARRAQEVVDARLGPLQKQLKEATGTTEQNKRVEAERARQAVYTALDEDAPTWREINSSQSFLAWLGDVDVFSGKTKRELLHQAFEANDAARVVGFFKVFQEDSARQSTPTARQPAVDIGTLAAPGSPRSGSPAGAPGGNDRVWTQQEIAEFYTQVSRKKISGEDRIRIEKEIVKAAAEGRVR